ncbi:hypothetical protein SDC9_44243 [bioreactor metagenome]|uniref:Disease resistance R13L4/SHOC-2-like LRR domain-containing protein n=1 Tax=bioreactor metagenome TaxID=1076179 RepID=A0A644W2U8_9ZZZZ
MKIYTILSLFIIILLPFQAISQSTGKVYDNLDEALANPAAVTRYYLDCSDGEDSAFFATIDRFPNLKSLTVVGYEARTFPVSLARALSLETFSVSECLDIDFGKMFSLLSGIATLVKITIDECELVNIPAEITRLPALNTLVISNCDNLNTEKCVDILAGCKNLKYLGLPVNDICELPANMGKLGNIETLDISNNALLDLPQSMSLMNQLDTLYTTNNLFLNPMDEFAGISTLQIRYLSVDSAITDEEKQKLATLFPNTTISFSSPGDQLLEPDTVNSGTQYGEFRSFNGPVQILSEAYLHYARLFNFDPGFDSTLFSERYSDPRYGYTNLISSLGTYNYNSIQMYLWASNDPNLPKGSICFNFYETSSRPYSQNIILNFREITAFRGMYWVLDEDMSRGNFKKNYINRRIVRRKPGTGWNDFRIYYDDITKSFTLEFKNAYGFSRIKAHPVFENTRDPQFSRDEYLKRFLRYSKTLDSRRKRFDKRIVRSLSTYRKTMLKIYASQWKSFVETYFSSTEKAMTQDQWLQYYDMIIANEKTAFESAPVSENLLIRYLDMNKYIYSNSTIMLGFDTLGVPALVDFIDETGNKCVVKRIFILNTMQKIYVPLFGTLGFEPQRLFIGPSSDIVMIVFLRNGKIGIVTRETFSKYQADQNGYEMKMKLFEGKLLTFGQLAAEAGL